VLIVHSSKAVLPGQIIAFFNSDQLIIHRVYAVKKGVDGNLLYAVWGDSSPGSHGEISVSAVAGRVHHLVRNGKKHSLWFFYPFCLLALLTGPLLRASVKNTKG
jgi:hypothetical protein